MTAKSDKGDALTLNLADKMLVVAVVKASMADIKDGDFIGSGAMPQPDGSQKAIEVHIFAELMRGTGEGFRPWDGAPNSTMTNGTVGNTVTSVDGPVITVKYKDGDKKIIVTPDVPIVRYEVADLERAQARGRLLGLGGGEDARRQLRHQAHQRWPRRRCAAVITSSFRGRANGSGPKWPAR